MDAGSGRGKKDQEGSEGLKEKNPKPTVQIVAFRLRLGKACVGTRQVDRNNSVSQPGSI